MIDLAKFLFFLAVVAALATIVGLNRKGISFPDLICPEPEPVEVIEPVRIECDVTRIHPRTGGGYVMTLVCEPGVLDEYDVDPAT